jgi:molybdate transport system substrate-binding protein
VLVTGTENTAAFNLDNGNEWLSRIKGSRLAVAQVESVPAGIYAKQSLTNLGVWKDLEAQTAPVSNVRLTLALVERQEANLGIVYKTDAQISDRVTIVSEFSGSLHNPIVYPAVQISDSESAADFYQYLSGAEARNILMNYGFK